MTEQKVRFYNDGSHVYYFEEDGWLVKRPREDFASLTHLGKTGWLVFRENKDSPDFVYLGKIKDGIYHHMASRHGMSLEFLCELRKLIKLYQKSDI